MLLCEARSQLLRPGDYAVVQTANGPELAKVTLGTTNGSPESKTQSRYVVRKATDADLESMRRFVVREVEARRDFFSAAAAEGMQVSAVRADYRYDGGALRIRFRSGARVSDTRIRERLTPKYGAGLALRNLGAPKELGPDSGCGGGKLRVVSVERDARTSGRGRSPFRPRESGAFQRLTHGADGRRVSLLDPVAFMRESAGRAPPSPPVAPGRGRACSRSVSQPVL